MITKIQKFYKREVGNILLFAHVNALTKNLPFSIEKAVLNFMQHYEVSEDEANLNTLMQTYQRMKKENEERKSGE